MTVQAQRHREPLAPPRWRPGRPLVALLAALAVVGATYAVARPDAGTEPAATSTVGSLQQIDHSIQAWTTNLTINDRDFYAATNLGLLYEARGRLTSDVGDYERARVALDRALAIVPADLPARVLHARVLLARNVVAEEHRDERRIADVGEVEEDGADDYTNRDDTAEEG